MSVRLKLALTIFATGLVTALLVIATVLYALQRFERETTFRRGSAFLQRVVATYDNLFDIYLSHPADAQGWLRSMVLFEPDTELYLLDMQGQVLVTSGKAKLAPGFRVAMAPVQQVLTHPDMPFVMGDDPERMDADAVIAVEPVRRQARSGDANAIAGYLYLVLHTQQMPEGRWDALRSSFARPVLGLVMAVVAFTTLLAALIIASVTRPLERLTAAVSSLSDRGIEELLAGAPGAAPPSLPPPGRDEFGRLTLAFEMMLAALRQQWADLRRLDHFRREGVSNLSHDLRSPLTATVACLETLADRWGANPDTAREPRAVGGDERRLIEVALRNTRNAARLVQSLGDLAQLDEPEFKLRLEVVDVSELLDDIGLRFASRAASQGIEVRVEHGNADGALPTSYPTTTAPTPVPTPAASAPAIATLDVELFERAIANLVDNALKFCSAGARITLAAAMAGDRIRVSVADTGPGIAAADLPHLFDRFYQSRNSVAPATGAGGRGLGLAIVKRIAELHGGGVTVSSEPEQGTTVVLLIPANAS